MDTKFCVRATFFQDELSLVGKPRGEAVGNSQWFQLLTTQQEGSTYVNCLVPAKLRQDLKLV